MQTKIKDIQAVCFDAGNTLIYPDYFFIQTMLAQYGVETNIDRLKLIEYEAKTAAHASKNSKPWKIYFTTWFKGVGVEDGDLAKIFGQLWRRHRQKNLWSLVNEDAVETLIALKNKHYYLGVISNWDGSLETLLKELKLSKYFNMIIDSELIGVRKPDASIFQAFLNRLKVRSQTVLYVGDSYEVDVLGAQRAGLHAVLFDPLEQYDYSDCIKIASLKQIFDII